MLNLSEIHPDVRKTLHEIENAMVRDISPNTPQAGEGGDKSSGRMPDIGDVGKPIADKAFFSDATLTILTNKNNPVMEVRFQDVFPVSLSGLDYNQNVTDVEYLTATIDFRYKLYEMVKL